MDNAILDEDDRYLEIFDPAKEAAAMGYVTNDLAPRMNQLRDESPVHEGSLFELLGYPGGPGHTSQLKAYTIFSFEACDRAFRDNETFSSEIYKHLGVSSLFGHSILEMGGDEHRRYRAAAQPMFIKPKVVTWWRENWIEEIADTLLDNLQPREKADLNFDLCARMPMHVVTRGIGMDGAKALNFREHMLRSGARSASGEERMQSMAAVMTMLQELINDRRANPREDVVSKLIERELALPDGTTRKLTDDEIFSYCKLTIFAGGGTTWRQLGITIHALLTHQNFWQDCCENRALIDTAIDEGLRWRPTDPMFSRLTSCDVEIHGQAIPAGTQIDVCLGAANRDPARWDRPDEYDIYREAKYNLGVGLGPHQCLGQYVARQEMVTAINGLMDRFPNLRLDPDAPEPVVVGGVLQRGLSALPVLLH